MNKRYFFFDIDGTITERETRKPVESAVTALHKLQEAGHFVAIATGRAHYKSRNFMEEMGLHHMVCCGGGGLVMNDQLIRNTPLDLEKARRVVKKAEELGYGVLLQLDDSIDVYARNDLFRQQVGERKEPTRYLIDPDLDIDQVSKIYKIYISIPEEDEYLLGDKEGLGTLRFVKDYLMFQYDAKDQGIIDMVTLDGGNIEDVVVFGDDYNDLVMFRPEWTSVAMGNACQALKDKATFIAPANVDDGIYRICEQLCWFCPVDQD